MSDIFLSYKSEDRQRAKIIAEALEHHGYSVWWDRIIPPGKAFDQVIEEALDAAKCVIVLWSRESVSSDWVKNEAREGLRRRILVPVLIDGVKIPFEFEHIQAAQLIDWQGALPNPEFEQLLKSVGETLGKPPITSTKDKKPSINELNLSAQQLYEEGKYPKAIDAWKKILNLDPENRTALDGIKNAKSHVEEKKERERKRQEEIKRQKAKQEEEGLKKKTFYKKILLVALVLIGIVGIYLLITHSSPPLSISVTESTDPVFAGGTSQVTVHVTTSEGTPVSGASVSVSATGGSLNPPTGTTDANGDFKLTYSAPGTAGSYKISATASKTGYTNGSSSDQITENPVTTPKQISPPDGTKFSQYPRTTTLVWESVPGAVSYNVEIQFYSGTWVTFYSVPFKSVVNTATTAYTFDFIGAQPGRWRVWAVDANGQESPKSGWWIFVYTN